MLLKMEDLDLQRILNSDQSEIITQTSDYVPPHRTSENHTSLSDVVDTDELGDISDINLVPIIQDQNDIGIGIGEPVSTTRGGRPRAEPVNQPSRIFTSQSFNNTPYAMDPSLLTGQQDWRRSHSVAYGLWVRNKIIDFARTVAGLRGVDVNRLLKTGFEDMTSIIGRNMIRSTDIYLPTTTNLPESGNSSHTVTDGDPDGPWMFETEREKKAFLELLKLKEELDKLGDHHDSLRAYRYLTTRQERFDYNIMRWLTLPMNLGQIYFQDTLKAAIETGIMMVRQVLNITAGSELFAQILETESNIVFANLVSKIMAKVDLERTRGHKREFEYERLDHEIHDYARQMSDLGGIIDVAPRTQIDTSALVPLSTNFGKKTGGVGINPKAKIPKIQAQFNINADMSISPPPIGQRPEIGRLDELPYVYRESMNI